MAKPLMKVTKKDQADMVVDGGDSISLRPPQRSTLHEPVLTGPDFEREFKIQTDASDFGIGAVLTQTSEEGEERPMAYF